ncbi:magnesium-dependent phosphatase-1 [Mangrovibacterium lignilyticum]|uniref:magnesium-dependent phosphatase-1 n=1 Tax=Mangrovibacterium lignilyticum TaxID=2668052 RepID=UPI0013D2D0BA|nr:magnesium-dependent phosphatase-1 [Mangrovibacterium lignilyticum]
MKLFVFDLDFTIWNAGGTWCDSTHPPFAWKDGKLKDQEDRWIFLYPEVKEILSELKAQGHSIAVASRTNAPTIAKQLLHMFEIDHFFDAREIYPGSKLTHFKRIMKELNVSKGDIVFFDDEYRNIEDVRSIGIESVLVTGGLTKELMKPYLVKSITPNLSQNEAC